MFYFVSVDRLVFLFQDYFVVLLFVDNAKCFGFFLLHQSLDLCVCVCMLLCLFFLCVGLLSNSYLKHVYLTGSKNMQEKFVQFPSIIRWTNKLRKGRKKKVKIEMECLCRFQRHCKQATEDEFSFFEKYNFALAIGIR